MTCAGARQAGEPGLRPCRHRHVDASGRELLKNLAEIDIQAISYKGGMPAINDLLGGQIPLSFNNGPESVGQLAPHRPCTGGDDGVAGRVPARRSLDGRNGAGLRHRGVVGLLGPAGMPADLVEKLSHDFVAALTRRRSASAGQARRVPDRQFAESVRRQDHADYDKWGPIIKPPA